MSQRLYAEMDWCQCLFVQPTRIDARAFRLEIREIDDRVVCMQRTRIGVSDCLCSLKELMPERFVWRLQRLVTERSVYRGQGLVSIFS